MAYQLCKRPASHKFMVQTWQWLPARPPLQPSAGYAPYEVICRRCGETDVFDDMGGRPIGEAEALEAGLEMYQPDEFDTEGPLW